MPPHMQSGNRLAGGPRPYGGAINPPNAPGGGGMIHVGGGGIGGGGGGGGSMGTSKQQMITFLMNMNYSVSLSSCYRLCPIYT